MYANFFSNGVGSSPRVRGAEGQWRPRMRVAGIIPARAGSSLTVSAISASVRDHPRACGEQWVGYNNLHYDQGSSPRVRGAD